ncbi:MAG: 2-oxo acid dehydrogenase subunit E2 [Clostridia bacterium]|nr:2-oxo acid dehydrogenase subunit E2 [Clostridia bacterium]
MFGRRSDGWLIKQIDPINAVVPYIMPQRVDSQVMMNFEIDYTKLMRYVAEKKAEGHDIRFMDVIIAAYVRSIAELPELNRFVVNKRTYARKTVSVSFAVLRSNGDNVADVDENTTKCYFDPRDTIFDVSRRVTETIEQARKPDADNPTMKVAEKLLTPMVMRPAVALLMWMDKHGAMPRFVIDASPFHTGLFLTNNGSVGLPAVNHHIYNFGTTSMFWSMGTIKRKVEIDKDGKPVRARYLPIGVTIDERVAAGRVFGMMIRNAMRYFNDPALLETPIETVLKDEGHEAALPKVK